MPPTRGFYQSFQFRHFCLRQHSFKVGESVLHQSLSLVLKDDVHPLNDVNLTQIWTALCASATCRECVCFAGRSESLPVFFSRDLCLLVEADELCRFSKLLVRLSRQGQLF